MGPAVTIHNHESFARAVRKPEEELDLGRAALVIAQGEYPSLEVEACLAEIDRLAQAVNDRAGSDASPYRMIATLNYVLFNEEGYRGERDDYYNPKNSFLNDVLERKRGIPITLSVLYMEVARRVGLTVEGVGFPGHFLVKYVGRDEIVIDPFHHGEIRSIQDLETFLDQLYNGKVRFCEEFLAPVGKRQILKRMLNNLKMIYLNKGDLLKVLSVVERMVILDPDSPQEIRDRGLLYFKLDCIPQALADFENYLRLARAAEDAVEIRELVVSLKRRAPQIH